MKTAIIILASGKGKRFGSNKLLAFLKQKRVIDYALEAALGSKADQVLVVCSQEVERCISPNKRIAVIKNDEPELGMGRSIQMGVAFAKNKFDAVIISAADQPLKTSALYDKLIGLGEENPGFPACASIDGDPRNPALFPSEFYDELMRIEGDIGARRILRKTEEAIKINVDERVLLDIDKPEDLLKIESILDSR